MILFCQDPLADKQADARFIEESLVADRLGLAIALLDFEALEKGNVARAVRYVPNHRAETLAIYRGWNLSTRHYDLLYEALLSRGIRLINAPDAYGHTQLLPQALDVLKDKTPRTVWFKSDGNVSIDMVMNILLPFSGRPVIVRDFARSQKHYWNEACYIPSSSDRQVVEPIINRFLELQGQSLTGGLVFREYVDLKPVSETTSNAIPLSREYRVVYWDGEPLATWRYWEQEQDDTPLPDLSDFNALASQIQSRFFVMDIAQKNDETWIVIDLGDAQVTPFPENADLTSFYQAVLHRLS